MFIPVAYEFPNHGLLDRFYKTRYEFSLVDWTLNLIREQLVIPVTFLYLLHPWAYFATLVIIVVHGGHSWVTLLYMFICVCACTCGGHS